MESTAPKKPQEMQTAMLKEKKTPDYQPLPFRILSNRMSNAMNVMKKATETMVMYIA